MIRSADDLIEYLGITQPDDIDLEIIAMASGVVVEYRPLHSCEARLVGTNQEAIVTVDLDQKNIARQRFSIAHELGHWFNDRGRSFSCQTKDISSSGWRGRTDPESRANRFAAELLMPQSMFREVVNGKPITFDTVRCSAEVFSTSLTSSAIRLVELNEKPCLVACYDQKRRLWFSRNSSITDEIWPVNQVSHEAEAFEILFGEKTEQRAREVDADMWIDRRDSYKYTVMADSVQVAHGVVLVILWWKNEAQILDLI